ncbi:SEC-C metal-binding domain-containing protein [Marinifilum sp. D714]|uniref:SEC-C metal-binding domain-containing protein n=1 Tax=Marinifilum sp. D714 TaxID=2937523 RepID=UPI0027CDF4FE|nr:SEC-C metal-binding domain-containing protein [Marinifilum sp. D714]MDQ2180289.1 SEC-C domain-containing protein [Marinifilum sp. D714]
MKNLLDNILNFFNSTNEEEFYYVKMERNEKCYCDSGKKYKSCHYPDHQKRSKIAVRKIDEKTGEEEIKILSVKKLRKEHFRVRTSVN